MQAFRDTVTDQEWHFEDDVVPTKTSSGYVFRTIGGDTLLVPPTLVPIPFVIRPRDASQTALMEIAALEQSITSRRIREAVLGIDKGWLADTNNKIVELRLKLK